MTIAIGCDEAAYDLKEELKTFVTQLGHKIIDCGTFNKEKVLYPDIVVKVAYEIVNKAAERGILCYGTGIGMAMTANKFPGIQRFSKKVRKVIYTTNAIESLNSIPLGL